MKKILPLMIAAALASPVAMAHQAGDILVRGGLAFVSPQTSSDDVMGSGSEFEIDSNMQLGLTLSYLIGAAGAVLVVLAAARGSLVLLFVGLFLFGGGSTANYQARYAAVGKKQGGPAWAARHGWPG